MIRKAPLCDFVSTIVITFSFFMKQSWSLLRISFNTYLITDIRGERQCLKKDSILKKEPDMVTHTCNPVLCFGFLLCVLV